MALHQLPSQLKGSIDPYLEWALGTNFRDFPAGERLVLLARFPKKIDAAQRLTWSRQGLYISPWYDGYKHATVVAMKAKLEGQLGALKSEGDPCIELASPDAQHELCSVQPIQATTSGGPDTVLGIIDDGCPFAHLRYRAAVTPLPVRFVWNQGALGCSASPSMPVPYGAAFLQADLQGFLSGATSGAGIDEGKAYRLSGLPSLLRATSHGAHVMSLASGHAPGRKPVSLSGRNDIAFVQLPPDALDNPAGQWMDHYALDGIHAILFYARQMFSPPAQRVIINLSYGPQTGPHDGTSIFETAVDEIIATAGYDLHIVVPSGNSHRMRTHAEFDLSSGGGEIEWCVSPDCQVTSQLEIWPPRGVDVNDLSVVLTSPGGTEITATQPAPDGTAQMDAGRACGNGDQRLFLLSVAATARSPDSSWPVNPLAVPGRWKVEVKPVGAVAGVAHAYLARIDPNLGRRSRGHSGYLDSREYDTQSPQLDDVVLSSAEVAARGSMSGIATGTNVQVVAGYVASTRKPSLYSSGGPTRDITRTGPDVAYPCDDSNVRIGVLAGGNRSGTVLRMAGTSFAAPQLARDLMNGETPTPIAEAVQTWSERRFGKGRRP